MQTELTGVVVLFGAALVVAWVMRVLHAPTILGFLVAGVLVGPSGFGLIHTADDASDVHFFAELGLALLLFTVGLELSPAPLLRLGPRLLVTAAIQIIGTSVLGGLAAAWLLKVGLIPAALIGVALATSSTAIVLKHLQDQRAIDSPGGAIVTGILLVQDLVAIGALVLLPIVSPGAGASSTLWLSITVSIVGLVVVPVVASLAMPTVVRLVFGFGGREFTALFAIVMATAGAWMAGLADWSWALGSFIAGLLLAQTDIRHQIHAEITPFRDAFNALFFMSIGMLVDLEVIVRHPVSLGAAVVGTLLLKSLIAGAATAAPGWPLRLACFVGLGLSTVSEFGYVLVREGVDQRIVPVEALSFFVAWVVGTMLAGAALVPLAGPASGWIADRVQRLRRGAAGPARAGDAADASTPQRLSGHVIIVGYGVNGRNLATVLRATRIPFAVVEMNRGTAGLAREDGAAVLVGDATRLAILEEAGLESARALVVAIDDTLAVRSIVAQVHAARPSLYLLARTRHVSELEVLHHLGAHEVIPEEFETSIEIFAHVLKELAVPDNVIFQQVSLIRAGQYGMLRGRLSIDRSVRKEWVQLLEAALTQTFLLEDASPACGKTLRALDLRAATGVTVVAVTRGGKPQANPPPDFVLQAGDVLVLVGAHRELEAARQFLSGPAEPEKPESA